MGSKITIGYVFGIENKKVMALYLEELVNILSEEGLIIDFKFSLDDEGNEWKECVVKKNKMESSAYELLTKYYYGTVKLISNIVNLRSKEIAVTVEQTSEYFGFLIDLDEEDLNQDFNLEEIESSIINFVAKSYGLLKFDYAFCDHEAEIEYSPKEITKVEEEIYSLLFIPSVMKDEVEVKRSSWYLDGLTRR